MGTTKTRESDFALEFYGEGLRREKALIEANSDVKWHEADVSMYMHSWLVTAMYHNPRDLRTLLRATDMYSRRMVAEMRSGNRFSEGLGDRMGALMSGLGEKHCPYGHEDEGQEVGSPFWAGGRGEWQVGL